MCSAAINNTSGIGASGSQANAGLNPNPDSGAAIPGNLLWIALLTVTVFLIHGYHPLADDGAVYVAGIKKLADAGLYQTDAVFVLSPTRLSVFAHLLAPLVSRGHVPLPVLLLICHLVSIFLFLLGSLRVAQRIFPNRIAVWGAVLLAACCFTLPVAGTSLCIMDPYVTARSFSTPLSLFAIAAVLDENWKQCAAWLVLTAMLHPLMAAFTAIAVLALALTNRGRWRSIALLCLMAYLMSAGIFFATHSGDPADPYNRAALSRSYYFLSSWHWYEYPGLLMPLLLLGFAASRIRGTARTLAISATIVGAVALVISLSFVHRDGSLLLARLQVLRAFQFVYIAGVILAGGMLGDLARKYKRAILVLYLFIAAGLFTGQRFTYPESSHVEWPGRAARNQWRQAFLWIRANVPRDAVFALDNDYIESPGEDAQGFRATAERSALADWFKDGGIASNFREASNPWVQGAEATAGINRSTDAQRLAKLRPLGANWIVLPVEAMTDLPCPYTNRRVRVCRLAIFGGEGAQ